MSRSYAEKRIVRELLPMTAEVSPYVTTSHRDAASGSSVWSGSRLAACSRPRLCPTSWAKTSMSRCRLPDTLSGSTGALPGDQEPFMWMPAPPSEACPA